MSFSANNLHTYDGVSSTDIIGSDVFFEIIEPEELSYTYRIRPAKDFGAPLVSSQRNILRYKNNKYFNRTVVFCGSFQLTHLVFWSNKCQ
jgi:hypothetical protein